MEQIAFWSMLIGLASMLVSFASLVFIIQIQRNGKQMQTEVWGYITNLSFIQFYDVIEKMKAKGIDCNALIEFWKTEYFDGAEDQKTADPEYVKKYMAAVTVLLEQLKK